MAKPALKTLDFRALAAFASTDIARENLRGIFADDGGYMVTTDGHRLFASKNVPCPHISQRGKLYLLNPYISDLAYAPILTDATFPEWRNVTPSVDMFTKTIAFFIPPWAVRLKNTKKEDACVVHIDVSQYASCVRLTFSESSTEVSFDLALLAPLADEEVFLHYRDKESPILITPTNERDPYKNDWFAIVMPWRGKADDKYRLVWESAKTDTEIAEVA